MPESPPSAAPALPARSLLLATTNAGKVREIAARLGDLPVPVEPLPADGPSPPEEGIESFQANARIKACHYSRRFPDRLVLAEDSGLVVDALDGAPGVESARFGGPDLTFPERCARILELLEWVPEDRRTARFVSAVALALDGAVLHECYGECVGRIARRPAGAGGFGYDPIFFSPELEATFAACPPEAKNRVSHRARALEQVRTFLHLHPELFAQAS